MLERLKRLWRVTAVRLSVAYTLAFGLMAVVLVVYMTGGAVHYLREQFQESINQEAISLRQIYRNQGISGVIRTMEARSRAPGANLYVVMNPSGEIIAGNVRSIERDVLREPGWHLRPFEYEGFREADDRERRAIARSMRLPNGMTILIGEDIGEPERFRHVVRRALSLSMSLMLLVGFLIWFFVGRRALKRIDMVAKSTERILGGDTDERLPVIGTNDEFDRLSTRMNTMLDRIHLLDSGLRNVSDSIAHDLKTPLTRLRNKADAAMQASVKGGEQTELLSEIIADADQLIKTFNALLMISRVESGSQVAEFSELDMSELMVDVVDLYEPVAEDEGFELKAEIAPGVKLSGNRELLSQAIANLIENAIKYAKPENGDVSLIRVVLETKPGGVRAAVADNGPGIPADQHSRALERFGRLDESRSKPGNGLGLSLVEAIAKLHGGRLELGDANPGLIVTLNLPKSG